MERPLTSRGLVAGYRSSGVQISWDDYLDYRNRKNEQLSSSSTSEESVPVPSESAVPAPGGLHGAAPPLSFTNIADMIISGKTHLIPNNDMVSNELNVCTSFCAVKMHRLTVGIYAMPTQEEQPSESKAQAPRKPWEKDAPIISDELLAPEATVSP